MISQGGVWVRRAQSLIDLLVVVDSSITVRVRVGWIVYTTLIPQRQQPRAAVRSAEIGMGKINTPVDMGHRHTLAGGKIALRTPLISFNYRYFGFADGVDDVGVAFGPRASVATCPL